MNKKIEFNPVKIACNTCRWQYIGVTAEGKDIYLCSNKREIDINESLTGEDELVAYRTTCEGYESIRCSLFFSLLN